MQMAELTQNYLAFASLDEIQNYFMQDFDTYLFDASDPLVRQAAVALGALLSDISYYAFKSANK